MVKNTPSQYKSSLIRFLRFFCKLYVCGLSFFYCVFWGVGNAS